MLRPAILLALFTLSIPAAHADMGGLGGTGGWRSGGGSGYGDSSRVGGHHAPSRITGGEPQAEQAQGPVTGRADTFHGTNRSTMARNIDDDTTAGIEPAAGPAPRAAAAPARHVDHWSNDRLEPYGVDLTPR